VAADPRALGPDLAGALSNFSTWLSGRGRFKDAAEAAEKATLIRRHLSEADPSAFAPDLAGSLNNQGTILSRLGRHEDALGVS
jgi:hypothetical protein